MKSKFSRDTTNYLAVNTGEKVRFVLIYTGSANAVSVAISGQFQN